MEDEGRLITRQFLARSVAWLLHMEDDDADKLVEIHMELGLSETRAGGTQLVVTDAGYEIAGRTRVV